MNRPHPKQNRPQSPFVLTVLCFGLTALVISCTSGAPACGQEDQAAESRWYKGNMHTHSLWSDGNDFPEMIAQWYRDQGYQFLTLSDHNILSIGEKWIGQETLAKRGADAALDRYRNRFGDDWVETREVDGRLQIRLKTLEEFRSKLEEPEQFLLVQSEEITDHFGSLPVHINATNLEEVIRPQGGDSVVETIQNNLKAVQLQRVKVDRPVIAHLNHPNFGYGVSATDLAEATREDFFEIFNGHPSVNQKGDASHMSVEKMWDFVNCLRLTKFEDRPLFGVATDDSHHYFTDSGSISGRGWVQVRSTRLDPDSLVESMERGDFYASTGVELKTVQWDLDSRELRVEVQPQKGANYKIRFVGAKKQDAAALAVAYENDPDLSECPEAIGSTLAVVEGESAMYQIPNDVLYVRAVIESDQSVARPVWDGQVEKAWTQPVGWRDKP